MRQSTYASSAVALLALLGVSPVSGQLGAIESGLAGLGITLPLDQSSSTFDTFPVPSKHPSSSVDHDHTSNSKGGKASNGGSAGSSSAEHSSSSDPGLGISIPGIGITISIPTIPEPTTTTGSSGGNGGGGGGSGSGSSTTTSVPEVVPPVLTSIISGVDSALSSFFHPDTSAPFSTAPSVTSAPDSATTTDNSGPQQTSSSGNGGIIPISIPSIIPISISNPFQQPTTTTTTDGPAQPTTTSTSDGGLPPWLSITFSFPSISLGLPTASSSIPLSISTTLSIPTILPFSSSSASQSQPPPTTSTSFSQTVTTSTSGGQGPPQTTTQTGSAPSGSTSSGPTSTNSSGSGPTGVTTASGSTLTGSASVSGSKPTVTGSSGSGSAPNTASSTTVTIAPPPTSGVFSVKPTGVISGTVPIVPSSLVVFPSTATNQPQQTALGNNDPQFIQPPDGMPSPIANNVQIQIGFDYSLNYPFVAGSPTTVSQIFSFLPIGVSWALGLVPENVTMSGLKPYNTTQQNGFITTLALAWIPQSMLDTLELDIHTAVSKLYQNPDTGVAQLMSHINPAIPILAGQDLSPVAPGVVVGGTGASPASTATSEPGGGGAPLGGSSASSGSAVQASSVGIGVGVVAGAAAYGVAMFFVARRYKKNRAAHRRASSLLDGFPEPDSNGYEDRPEMVQAYGPSGSFNNYGSMNSGDRRGARPGLNQGINPNTRDSHGSGGSGGSRGMSVRSVGISAPLMSENSLGWN